MKEKYLCLMTSALNILTYQGHPVRIHSCQTKGETADLPKNNIRSIQQNMYNHSEKDTRQYLLILNDVQILLHPLVL
jgi:hypothetical protein